MFKVSLYIKAASVHVCKRKKLSFLTGSGDLNRRPDQSLFLMQGIILIIIDYGDVLLNKFKTYIQSNKKMTSRK